MENNTKIPRIRFKGFDDAWEQRKLSCFATKAVDNRGKTPPLSEEGTHPLIEVAALGNGHPDYSKVDKYLDDYSFEHNLRDYIKKGDILFSTVGSIGLVSIMDSRENAVIAQNIVAFRAKEGYLPKFLYSLFSTVENQDRANRIVMGAVQPSIKVSQLVDVEYHVTNNIKEQRMVGELFYKLDNLITLHQRKLNKMQNYKKAMLDKMFPENGCSIPKLRFHGFNNLWEQCMLGDLVGNTYGGGTPKTSETDYWNGTIPWIQSSNVAENQLFDVDVKKCITELGLSRSAAQLVPKNSIAVVSHVGVGKLIFMSVPYTTSQDFISLSELKCDAKYLCYALYKKLQEDLHIVQGSAIKGITKEDLLSKMILLPSEEEQQKIAATMMGIDNTIILQQNKVEKLNNIKQSMLERMFVL